MHFQHLLTDEVQQFIARHLGADVTKLALQARQHPHLPLTDIINQIRARQKAKAKLPAWYAKERVLFPPLLSLEQASSEQTALYKAALVEGQVLIDLTGGFGVDAYYFARRFDQVIHVERNEALSDLAAYNFAQLGIENVTFERGDSVAFLEKLAQRVDCIYLDPARRGTGNEKVVRLSDCEPDVGQLLPFLFQKADQILLKTSPMLDIDLALGQLERVTHIDVVSVENECKEVLYRLGNEVLAPPVMHTINFPRSGAEQRFSFTKEEEQAAVVAYSAPLTYLYEPNASILKAGAFKSVALRYGLHKLHPNSHLYTSDEANLAFPGRIFRCKAISKLDKKELRAHLPEAQANITVRNFPMSVADIRRKTGIREGGETYILATTDHQGKKVLLITEKVTPN